MLSEMCSEEYEGNGTNGVYMFCPRLPLLKM